MATPSPMSEQTLMVYSAMSITCESPSTTAIPPTTASAPTPDRQRRRDDGAEDEQEDEERERQRDELGADEVVLEHAVEVVHEGHLAGAGDGELGRAELARARPGSGRAPP